MAGATVVAQVQAASVSVPGLPLHPMGDAMHAKRISRLFLLALLVGAPASAQWFIHYQTPENDVWRKSPHAWADEALALQNARNHCLMGSNFRAAKIVGPGKETVYPCQALIASHPAPPTTSTMPSAAPAALPALIEATLPRSVPTPARGSAIEAMRRITGATRPAPEPDTTHSLSTQASVLEQCEQDQELNMLADCQCARAAFAARPASSGSKSGSRLALEACPAPEARR